MDLHRSNGRCDHGNPTKPAPRHDVGIGYEQEFATECVPCAGEAARIPSRPDSAFRQVAEAMSDAELLELHKAVVAAAKERGLIPTARRADPRRPVAAPWRDRTGQDELELEETMEALVQAGWVPLTCQAVFRELDLKDYVEDDSKTAVECWRELVKALAASDWPVALFVVRADAPTPDMALDLEAWAEVVDRTAVRFKAPTSLEDVPRLEAFGAGVVAAWKRGLRG